MPPTFDPAALRSVTLPLDSDFDPIVVAGDDGYLFASPSLTLAGHGIAARLVLPAGLDDKGALHTAQAQLAGISIDDRVALPGTGVIALGAIPFDRRASATLVIPRVTLGRDSATGKRWATLVAPDDVLGRNNRVDTINDTVSQLLRSVRARSVSLRSPDRASRAVGAEGSGAGAYLNAVRQGLGEIATGRLRKVVLARHVDLRFNAPTHPSATLRRLIASEPACTAFSHPVEEGRFVGASPELIVSRRGGSVSSRPLAGTVALSGDLTIDSHAVAQLATSVKDHIEHTLVVEAITEALGAAAVDVTTPSSPGVVRLGSVAHLATEVAGTQDTRGAPGVLELLAGLHPTPAVGGVAREPALDLISALEQAPRGPWAGPVGWVDGNGDGEWMLGIRSAVVKGAWARLWAGAGIVAASDPDSELAETMAKLLPVAEALSPGASEMVLEAETTDRGVLRR